MPRLRFFAAAALPQISKEGAPDDETFWAYVRSEFELAPEFTNLVSVVRGKFTKANREIALNEATRLNRLPGLLPDPDQDHEIRSKVAGFIGAPTDNIALLRNTTEGVTTADGKGLAVPIISLRVITKSSCCHVKLGEIASEHVLPALISLRAGA